VVLSGDVNNDTFSDIIIGGPNAINSASVASGVSYVIYGRRGWSRSDIDLRSLTSDDGFRIDGAEAQDAFGLSVSGAGTALHTQENISSVFYRFAG
jgi:hypothetical protein